MRLRSKIFAASMGVGVALALLPALPAQAAPVATPVPAGTQVLVAQGAAAVVIAACTVEIGILGGFLLNAIQHAAGSNACLRIRYGALPTAFYSDNSGFCHDT